MLHVGYTTPYRVILLLLIKRLCTFDYPEELIPTFVIYITKKILNEDSVRETCSEPRLNQLFNEIAKFKEGEIDMQPTITSIQNAIEIINHPRTFDEFMTSLKEIVAEEEEEDEEMTERPARPDVILERCSVMGLFVRRCRIEYAILPIDRLADIVEAFNAYIHNNFGDSYFLPGGQTSSVKSWVSVYNIKEFLKAEANKIDITGTSNIHPTDLDNYLRDIETVAPDVLNIRQVRYLNYLRTREYVQSVSDLHIFYDHGLKEEVPVQYALLNLGILEFKFGHISNALSSFNDALSAARSNKDEYCLQEVQYWIGTCRKNEPFSDTKPYDNAYLANMRILTEARNLLSQGAPSRHVFKLLQISSANIITKDIKDMSRVQFLITSLAWQRYGNSVLADSFLKLAENSGDKAVQDIEKTVISHANMLQSIGDSDKALQVLQQFKDEYPTECTFLIHWKQAQARIKKLSNGKRKFDMMEDQADKLNLLVQPYSEEYFNSVHDNAKKLISKMEYGKALSMLEEVHDFIRKTDQTEQLSFNLILKAVVNLRINEMQAAIALALEAMATSKRSHNAEQYYKATIILAEAYVRTGDRVLIEKSVHILENIFPQVLLVKSMELSSKLYLTYAEALDASSSNDDCILEYVTLAAGGFRELRSKDLLVRALLFKIVLLQKLNMSHHTINIMQEIRDIQSKPF